MLQGECPHCAADLTLPRTAGTIVCPACDAPLRVLAREGAWVLQQQAGPRRAAPDDQLTWFELQVAPHYLRLSLVPDQPVVFGELVDGVNEVYVVEDPAARGRLLAGVEYLVHTQARLFQVPEMDADQAFDPERLTTSSVHVRAACADGRQWAAVYDGSAIPGSIAGLFDDLGQFARAALNRLGTVPVDAERARQVLNRAREDAGK